MARKFFYVCAGMFLLALAYHLGAGTAAAQFGQVVSGVADTPGYGMIIVTNNGDTFIRLYNSGGAANGYSASPPISMGNFWSGGPTPALHESWGQLKSRYAPSHGPTSQPPTDR